MLETSALRMLGFAAGSVLHVFLAAVLWRKASARMTLAVILILALSGGLWHAANSGERFYSAAFAEEGALLPDRLRSLGDLGLALACAALLHLGLLWAGFTRWAGFVLYPAAVLVWWLDGAPVPFLLAGSLAGGALLTSYAAWRLPDTLLRRFYGWFAATLAMALAGTLVGRDSATVVFASLAPALCVVLFIYRFNLYGLLIGRRVVFALALAVFSAVYLYAVRLIARHAELDYLAHGDVIELLLIFAAGVIWIPLYSGATRFLSRRTQLFADFSKRLIQEAAGILDLGDRLQYLADRLGRAFNLRRVVLATCGRPDLLRSFPRQMAPANVEELAELEKLIRDRKVEYVRALDTADRTLAGLFTSLGFSYLFPLRYEDQLMGMLLVDTSPRMYLDEDEPILRGLASQISHSIMTHRVVEEKISLEKALLRQEHLATLGKVAATIAHEVKNPLSSIKTLAQLMREDPGLDPQYGRDINYIIAETDRLNACVQQLLSFSRPVPAGLSDVPVSSLLGTLAETLHREYGVQGISIDSAIEPGAKVSGADPQIIQQIVLNLMLNAVQAAGAGGTVRLDARRIDGYIAIAVSDTGPGIPAEIRERIFDPFFTTKQKGTGLGLAIVRKNLRHLGGEIELDTPLSQVGGTRITIRIPEQCQSAP
jgi:signal transduction histidine kinase